MSVNAKGRYMHLRQIPMALDTWLGQVMWMLARPGEPFAGLRIWYSSFFITSPSILICKSERILEADKRIPVTRKAWKGVWQGFRQR